MRFCGSIAYQLFVNIAFNVFRNASLVWLVGGVSIAFVSYRIFLENSGMLPVVKVGESMDRIFIGGKPDPITKIYMRVLGMMTCMHATYSIIKMVTENKSEDGQLESKKFIEGSNVDDNMYTKVVIEPTVSTEIP